MTLKSYIILSLITTVAACDSNVKNSTTAGEASCPSPPQMKNGEIVSYLFTYQNGTNFEYQITKESDDNPLGFINVRSSDGYNNYFKLDETCGVQTQVSLTYEEIFLLFEGEAPMTPSNDNIDNDQKKVDMPPINYTQICNSEIIESQVGEFNTLKCVLTSNDNIYQIIHRSQAETTPLKGLVYFEQNIDNEKMTVELIEWLH